MRYSASILRLYQNPKPVLIFFSLWLIPQRQAYLVIINQNIYFAYFVSIPPDAKLFSFIAMDKWLLLYDIQSRKTPQRGFVFSNYQSLNNWNLLLELGEILTQKPLETSCFESENQIFCELSKPQSILNKGSFQMMIILEYWKSSLQFDNASIYVLFVF